MFRKRSRKYLLLLGALVLSAIATVLGVYSRFSEVYALLTIVFAVSLLALAVRDAVAWVGRRSRRP